MTKEILPTIIVGGGSSGTILAAQLARLGGPPAILVERAATRHGRGLAYATSHPRHILNVRAAGMSAFPDQPDHFARWLARHGHDGAQDFVPRGVYGAYLRDVLQDAQRGAGPAGLAMVRGDVAEVARGPQGLAVRLADGRMLAAGQVVLSLGNLPPPAPDWLVPGALAPGDYIDDPWGDDLADRVPPNGTVLVLGSGLTAVDVALRLDAGGFRGTVLCLSRRGLKPHRHLDGTIPMSLRETTPAPVLSRLVAEVRARAAQVGWHAAVDELRPVTQALWADAPVRTRARFLRHLRPWWDTHRHRLAPAVADRLDAMIAEGRVRIAAGRVVGVERCSGRLCVTWRPRHQRAHREENVVAIVSCGGPQTDVRRTREPLLDDLLARGMIRPDPLALGIDVDPSCRVIDARGEAQGDLFCIGPMSRGTFWEIVAVPDIRRQCEALARRLAAAHAARIARPMLMTIVSG